MSIGPPLINYNTGWPTAAINCLLCLYNYGSYTPGVTIVIDYKYLQFWSTRKTFRNYDVTDLQSVAATCPHSN